jgi:hypothetical protein
MWSKASQSATTALTSLGKTRTNLPSPTATQTLPGTPVRTLNLVQVRLSTTRFETPHASSQETNANEISTTESTNTPTSDITGTTSILSRSKIKRPTSGAVGTTKAPSSWKYKMIMEVSVWVPKGGVPFKIFRDRLFAGLDFLHKYGEDPTIAFLPKQDDKSKGKPPLLAASDFPQVQCYMRLYYFSFPHTYSFSEVRNDKGRRIVFSTLMGFNTNPKHYLSEMAGDLDELHCSFTRKNQQAMEVENAAVFWGAPQYMCKSDMKIIADSYLQPLEIEMMREDLYSFPAAIHAQPWPEYVLSLNSQYHLSAKLPVNGSPSHHCEEPFISSVLRMTPTVSHASFPLQRAKQSGLTSLGSAFLRKCRHVRWWKLTLKTTPLS